MKDTRGSFYYYLDTYDISTGPLFNQSLHGYFRYATTWVFAIFFCKGIPLELVSGEMSV